VGVSECVPGNSLRPLTRTVRKEVCDEGILSTPIATNTCHLTLELRPVSRQAVNALRVALTPLAVSTVVRHHGPSPSPREVR